MSRRVSPARRRGPGALVGPLVAVAVVGGLVFHLERERREEIAAYEAERAATVSERTRRFRSESLETLLELCQRGWTDELGFYGRPRAVAWSRERVDGYFLHGVDGSSWRRLGCDAEGVRRGPRVARPFVEGLPAEAAPGMDAAVDDGVTLGLVAVAATRLEGDLLAVEVVGHPQSGTAVIRRWRGLEGGARAAVEPSDAPPFGSLVAEAPFPVAPGEPAPLDALPRHRWLDEPELAFDVLAGVIPAGARIVEIDLGEERIEVSVEHPTPAFDGQPPAPYGDLELDDAGVPESSWWYPREDPGFGCRQGRPLAHVRADFVEARASVRGRLHRAWYSCSPAYSNGERGTWHLLGPGP